MCFKCSPDIISRDHITKGKIDIRRPEVHAHLRILKALNILTEDSGTDAYLKKDKKND